MAKIVYLKRTICIQLKNIDEHKPISNYIVEQAPHSNTLTAASNGCLTSVSDFNKIISKSYKISIPFIFY